MSKDEDEKVVILYDIHLHNCDEHVQVNADEVDEFMTEHGDRTIKFKLEGETVGVFYGLAGYTEVM